MAATDCQEFDSAVKVLTRVESARIVQRVTQGFQKEFRLSARAEPVAAQEP